MRSEGGLSHELSSEPAMNVSNVEVKHPRVLILTHSHPKLTSGGAEIAAGTLFQGLRAYSELKTWFLGCSHKPQTGRIGINLTQPFGEDDFLYQLGGSFDHFKFANRDPNFPRMFTELLAELQPDILHFHHYTNFGVEAMAIAKRALPACKIVLTLHEYLAICHNYGQMVKTKTYHLCESESPLDCQNCFPEIGARDFFLRKKYIKAFFEDVDLFTAPSFFLAERYIAWGVSRDKIVVQENVPPVRPIDSQQGAQSQQFEVSSEAQQPAVKINTAFEPTSGELGMEGTWADFINSEDARLAAPSRANPLRLGFFGQMSPLKGIIVLLAAARRLADLKTANIQIEIHGDYSNQPPEFQEAVRKGLKEAGHNVRYCGPYRNVQVNKLMQAVDAVVVPSIWWENSPVVIQEAYTNGKPVICSNIGGLAEKVRPGIDGFWFDVGDGDSLASLLLKLAHRPELLARSASTLRRPRKTSEAIDGYVEIYRSLLCQFPCGSSSS